MRKDRAGRPARRRRASPPPHPPRPPHPPLTRTPAPAQDARVKHYRESNDRAYKFLCTLQAERSAHGERLQPLERAARRAGVLVGKAEASALRLQEEMATEHTGWKPLADGR